MEKYTLIEKMNINLVVLYEHNYGSWTKIIYRHKKRMERNAPKMSIEAILVVVFAFFYFFVLSYYFLNYQVYGRKKTYSRKKIILLTMKW